MNAPKGIQIFKNLIYLADLDEVIVVDINKAAVVQHIRIEGKIAGFFIIIDNPINM